MKKSKIILGCIISVMAFALTLLIGLPNKVYASEIDDYIEENYSNLVLSNNLYSSSQDIQGELWSRNIESITKTINELPAGTYSISLDIKCISKLPDKTDIAGCFSFIDLVDLTNNDEIIAMSSVENQNEIGLTLNYQITFTIDENFDYRFRVWGCGNHSVGSIWVVELNNIMLNKGSSALPYEPYITGSMIYNEAYNKALINSMYWLNEYNTTLVDIVELNNNISYKDINNYTGTLNISYTTGLYGKADFRQLVSDFAYELANYEYVYEQFIEIELKFDSPIIFNKTTSTNFTTNDITGFTFYSSNGNEYNYDFSGTSEGAKDYVHNIVEGQNIYNVPFVKMKIRLIQTRYSTVPSPFISFVPDFYNLGYTEGYEIGNANGYNTGFNGGYDKGYNDGNIKGYNDGNIKGYNDGYTEGSTSNIETNGIKTLFNSILSYPVNMISSVFNFEFMGINIASLIMFIISIGIVAFVVKKFW